MKTIKKLFLLGLFCMMSIGASAYTFEVDGIYYSHYFGDTTCSVTYKDYHIVSYKEKYESPYTGVVNIPANVRFNGKTYSVKYIGWHAFEGCTSLTCVIIPNSVKWIWERAFFDCSGLTSITIPNSVTSIEEDAFLGCSGLTSVNITDLDKWAEIKFNGNITVFGDNSANPLCNAKKLYLNGELVTDAKLTTATKIGDGAFSGYTGLTSVTIGNSVTNIGERAFYGCSGLTSVTIGNSVKSIGKRAFLGCSGLTSIEIPNSVTSIGSSAFQDCTGLTSVTIPNSVESIGGYAFYSCSGLTSVTNLAITPQEINKGTFSKYGTLHVIKGFKNTYANADYWKKFKIVDDVEVTKVTSITIDESTYYCDINSTGQATATVKPDDAFVKKVTWSSSDPSKLFIDANTGQFAGLAVGEVTITATATDGSGVSGQAIVVVQDPT